MDDFAGNIATLGTFNINFRVTGNIEAAADQDWFQGWLWAGQTYVIQERGVPTTDGTLNDTFVRLHDFAGTQLAFNDDGGINSNSYLRFVPETSGFYFVDARSFSNTTGTYEVVVAQQADALTHYHQWNSGNAATVLLGDVNNAQVDIIDIGGLVSGPINGVREDIVSISPTGNVFVAFSNANGSGFAVPVLATTGGTASDRLFNVNSGADQREDLFQIFDGNAYVANGNAGDGLDDFFFWGSGFVSSAVVTHDFNGDGRHDAFQISGGNAQVSLQAVTNNAFLGFTNWATGLIGNEQLLNFNGDGRGDLLQIYDGNAYVATSNGTTAFNAFNVVETGLTASDRVADFNFDGRDDLFQVYNGNMYVSLSNGGTFTGFTQWGTGAGANTRFADFNGDNRTDVFQVDANGFASVALANSLGTGFSPFHVWARDVGPNDLLGLVNGDRLTDIVQIYNGNSYVWESIAVPSL